METIKSKSELKVRKFVPVDREYPIFEVLAEEQAILDVLKDDEGNLEIAFHEAISNRVMRVFALQEIIEACRISLEE